ncbi:MAG: acyl-CoA dehydrogenase family protein [Acidobacteriota bacterium]
MTATAPPVNQKATEKPSFAKGLFLGAIDESLVFPYPTGVAEERESLEMILAEFSRFAADRLDGARYDREMEIPQETIRELADLGILGFTVPEEYGGIGFSTGAYCRLMEQVCRHCAATATVVGGHQSIGIKGILLFGNEEQKKEFLPRLASGEWIGAYALTEPGSGSDAAAMTTRAVHDAGDDVWVLNGRKQWITNGGFAEVFTVFARTEIPGETRPTRTVSCFLVKRDLGGVSTTPPMHKLGIRGSNTVDVVFDNVRVPAAHLLGRLGGGFKMAMEILNTGRLSLAAGCVGACKEMIDLSVAHAKERKAFGQTIAEFEMIRRKFAAMMSETYAAESVVYLTTGLCDRPGLDFSLESAMSKVFASEVLWRVVNHAVQINGGNGYMSEYPFERFLRDARINLIFEGTNEILRMYTALAGLQRPGEALKEVGRALREPLGNIGTLTEFATHKIKQAVAPQKIEGAHPVLKEEADLISEWTARFAAGVERALRDHGKKIMEREYVQERIANAGIDLYAMIATVSRTTSKLTDGGEEAAAREVKLTRLFCRQAWRRMRRHLTQIEKNDDALTTEISDVAYADDGYKVG